MSAVSRQQDKGSAFRAMHAGDPFVIPNPWDAGSARVLEALGFTALATTSSGFAFTLGLLDGRVTLDEVAHHVAAIDAATDLPVSADLENGYGPSPADAAEAIRRVAEAGAVGGSIEDFDRGESRLYEIGHAAERIRAAVDAAHGVAFPFTLTARAENHIRGNADLDDTIRRLQIVRGSRRGRPVCAGAGNRRGDPRALRCGLEARQRPRHTRAVCSRDRGRRSATDQRRREPHLGRGQGVRRCGQRDPGSRGCLRPRRAGSAGRLVPRLISLVRAIRISVPGNLAGPDKTLDGGSVA